MLSERSQDQGLCAESIPMTFWKGPGHRARTELSASQGLMGKARPKRGSRRSLNTVPYLDHSGGDMVVFVKTQATAHFQKASSTACKLYLGRNV